MEQEMIDYLIREHAGKLTGPGMLAFRHFLHNEKLTAMASPAIRERMHTKLVQAGWVTDDEAALALLRDGVPTFRKRIAQYDEHGGEALLNNCPRCHRLARTFRARQCRYCGHDWH